MTYDEMQGISVVFHKLYNEYLKRVLATDPSVEDARFIGQAINFMSSFSSFPLVAYMEQCKSHPDPAARLWAYRYLYTFREINMEHLLNDRTLLN